MVQAISISAEDTHELRQRVLRPGQPRSAVVFVGDHDEATAHFGVVIDGAVVSVGSVYAHARQGQQAGWRVRGMATDASRRGRGHGAAVLRACLAHAASHGGGEVWCNARTPALSLYRRAGFEVVGDEFELPGIGPHHLMVLRENKS